MQFKRGNLHLVFVTFTVLQNFYRYIVTVSSCISSDPLLWCKLYLREEYNKGTMPFNEYLYITELLDLFSGGG